MSMRQTAIDVMKANAARPMGEVLPLIAAAIKRSIGEARRYYRWIVTHDRAPGVLQAGWIVFSSPYETPRSCAEAIAMLRENLGSANSDPDVVDQLMRDLSNFDAMSQPGNSYKLKMKNRCISQKALDLMSRCSSFDQWHEQTTNEHSTPINVLQKQIAERLHSITDEETMQMFRDNPVCTVTNEEDARLRHLGYHSCGTRDVRYAANGGAGIDMIQLLEKPHTYWR